MVRYEVVNHDDMTSTVVDILTGLTVCQCSNINDEEHPENVAIDASIRATRIADSLNAREEPSSANHRVLVGNPGSIIPASLQPGDIISIKVVAVMGQSGRDWAAYLGPAEWSPIDIADHGDKISEQAAIDLFYAPRAAGLKYWR
ncbi:MAG: hypothetical protein QUS07_07155 [Methanothrix sp.]|nr:hypothetical protein [Methanothrix sp.]